MLTEAFEVTEGDTLLDLNNGYVFRVENDGWAVGIHFHDAEGDENVLVVGPSFELNVREGDPV